MNTKLSKDPQFNKNYLTHCKHFQYPDRHLRYELWRCKMILLSTIINRFEDKFLTKHKQSILPSHKKALQVMKNCRTEASPHMLVQCTDHDRQQYSFIPHSCGHRNCLHCQSHEGQQWIDNQLGKQLPAERYLLTFTLTYQLRNLAWWIQKLVYTLFFFCVQNILKTFTQNDKKLKGMAG